MKIEEDLDDSASTVIEYVNDDYNEASNDMIDQTPESDIFLTDETGSCGYAIEQNTDLYFTTIMEKYFRCLLCDFDSNASQLVVGIDCYERDQFIEHFKMKHPEDLTKVGHHVLNKCDKCFEKLKNLQELKEHLSVCKEIEEEVATENKNDKQKLRKYVCDDCNKGYLSKRLLEDHINFVHGGNKNNVCSVCNKKFSSPYTLASHLKTHTERTRDFKCHICEKAFFSSSNLINHVKTHNQEKKFKCEDCDKTFG